MRRFLIAIMVIAGATSVSSFAAKNSEKFSIFNTASVTAAQAQIKSSKANAIFHKSFRIQRNVTAGNEDFYLLRMNSQAPISAEQIKKFAKIEAIEPNEFAVLSFASEADRVRLAELVHERNHVCGGLQLLPESVASDVRLQSASPLIPIERSGTFNELVSQSAQRVSMEALVSTIRTMVSWETRYHQNNIGKDTAMRLRQLYQSFQPTDRTDVEYELFTHRRTNQPSLIVRIRGTEEPEKLVILGSHLDAINRSTGNTVTPGADDNASGTATNLEIFRVLMEQNIRPRRTVEIHAYAAEEIGLVGSAEIASTYARERRQVQTMVQFDMNAYSSNGQDKIWFVSNNTNDELTSYLGTLVDTYVGMPWERKELWFGGSDHMSWDSNGFIAAFPTENPSDYNNNIHTSRDTLEVAVAYSQMVGHTKLGLAYILHYAGVNRDEAK